MHTLWITRAPFQLGTLVAQYVLAWPTSYAPERQTRRIWWRCHLRAREDRWLCSYALASFRPSLRPPAVLNDSFGPHCRVSVVIFWLGPALHSGSVSRSRCVRVVSSRVCPNNYWFGPCPHCSRRTSLWSDIVVFRRRRLINLWRPSPCSSSVAIRRPMLCGRFITIQESHSHHEFLPTCAHADLALVLVCSLGSIPRGRPGHVKM